MIACNDSVRAGCVNLLLILRRSDQISFQEWVCLAQMLSIHAGPSANVIGDGSRTGSDLLRVTEVIVAALDGNRFPPLDSLGDAAESRARELDLSRWDVFRDSAGMSGVLVELDSLRRLGLIDSQRVGQCDEVGGFVVWDLISAESTVVRKVVGRLGAFGVEPLLVAFGVSLSVIGFSVVHGAALIQPRVRTEDGRWMNATEVGIHALVAGQAIGEMCDDGCPGEDIVGACTALVKLLLPMLSAGSRLRTGLMSMSPVL